MSCLFDSLSTFLPNLSSKELRHVIVDYLQTNPILMAPSVKASDIVRVESREHHFPRYLQTMKKAETWGGALEIRSFAELFHMRVRVFVMANQKWIEFVPNGTVKRTVTIHWNGTHYTPGS
jgi:hypothetical protein|tara:strand:- start:1170 stop:1532 length:363 start_codon:yes stop_codon:yes gene_type:complete